jgi:AcrR family transcriptional regulator
MNAKSAETRARILDAAMELFRRQGFEETTMRQIAKEAGVATGAAYYYFDSKDAIALAFYEQSQQELEPLIEQALASGKHLKERLGALLEAKLKYFEPNRRLLGALAAHADPEHALSPFSARTREIRERDMASFARALGASGIRVPADLEPHLPRILWMYQMGIILFWIYDRSPAQGRTRK